MSLLARLFGKTDASPELLCPQCERAMDAEHDADACARKGLSRRFFFGVLGGAAVAVAMPQVLKVGDIFTIKSVYAVNRLAFHREAFTLVSEPFALEDFSDLYVRPAAMALMEAIDKRAAKFRLINGFVEWPGSSTQ